MISFVCLIFVFAAHELIGGTTDFIEKTNTETIVSFIKKNKLSAKKFAKKLDHYPLLNPNTQDKDGWTILHDLMAPSVKNGYLKAFIKKYASEIDINKVNSSGETVLTLGLFYKNHAALDIILKHTRSVNAKTAFNFLKYGKGHGYLKTDTYKTKYREKIIRFSLDLKKLLCISFLYSLAMPFHMTFDPQTWNDKKPFLHYFMLPVMLTIILAGSISLFWTALELLMVTPEAEKGSFIIMGKQLAMTFALIVGSFIGMFFRVFLVLNQQRRYPLLHQCIQKNSKLAVILDFVISSASLITLHRIRST